MDRIRIKINLLGLEKDRRMKLTDSSLSTSFLNYQNIITLCYKSILKLAGLENSVQDRLWWGKVDGK